MQTPGVASWWRQHPHKGAFHDRSRSSKYFVDVADASFQRMLVLQAQLGSLGDVCCLVTGRVITHAWSMLIRMDSFCLIIFLDVFQACMTPTQDLGGKLSCVGERVGSIFPLVSMDDCDFGQFWMSRLEDFLMGLLAQHDYSAGAEDMRHIGP